MLSSLFTKQSQQESGIEPLGSAETVSSPEKGKPKALRSLVSDLDTSTPHDAALAELYTKSSEENRPTLSKGPDLREVIWDPFDGKTLGTVVLPDSNLHPEAHMPLSDSASRNEEIWSHLSTVLDLQSQIAVLHLEMEGIGGKNEHGKGKGKGSMTSGVSPRPPIRVASATADLLDLEHDEGVGVGEDESEEQKKDREREEDFQRLAEQFEGRKEGLNHIMSKLEELSKGLTEFHALQAPNINFPSSLPVTNQTDSLSVPLPRISPPYSTDHSATILSPSRMLDSPDSAESHEFVR